MYNDSDQDYVDRHRPKTFKPGIKDAQCTVCLRIWLLIQGIEASW